MSFSYTLKEHNFPLHNEYEIIAVCSISRMLWSFTIM